ncbi:MAG TPA: signal peptidase I [Pyrinomonadaceae bacterium]|nr:signal peptidase I [Pyrinomonadaceae bacterium]
MSTNENEIKQPASAARPLGPPKSTAREYFESFVVTLVMAIFGMTFILQAVTVPTGSMQNTILIGDYLLVNKFIFAPGGKPVPFLPQREIQRGDIIVFKFPGYPNSLRKSKIEIEQAGVPFQTNFVKRVVGLPGDKIEIRNNQVYINDQLLPEQRIIGDSSNDESALDETEFEPAQPDQKYKVYYSEQAINGKYRERNHPFAAEGNAYTVPENSYFVMGDSRDRSLDSRYWGVVSRDLVIGRAMFVYWSCDRGASDGGMLGCITNPRLDRIGKMIK